MSLNIFMGDEDESENSGSSSSGDVKSEELDIYFYTGVSVSSVQKLIMELRKKKIEAAKLSAQFGIEVPIKLRIMSPGGHLMAGLAAHDAIMEVNSTVPVDTYVEGLAGSAATFLSIAGRDRYITSSSHYLVHQLSVAMLGKYSHYKIGELAMNTDLLMQRIRAVYGSHGIEEDVLDMLLENDLYTTPEQAVEYGFVDEILTY